MTTINLSTWCRRCGAEFTADRRAIVSGAWRLCPDCRDEPPRVPAADRPPRFRQNSEVQ